MSQRQYDSFPLPEPEDFLVPGNGISFSVEFVDLGEMPDHVRADLAFLLSSFGSTIGKPVEGYEVFRHSEEQEEIYEYSLQAAQFIIDNEVESVVLMDRATRPMYVGIKEVLKAVVEKDSMPDFKFVNPRGFRAREDYTDRQEKQIQGRHKHLADRKERPRKRRNRDEIDAEFRDTYASLVAKKDKPVLLLDTCLHGGDTVAPVARTLKEVGFSKVFFGVVHDTGDCPVPPTFSMTNIAPFKACIPFSQDVMVEKTYGSTHSVTPKNKRYREEAVLARREIRQIVTDRLARDGLIERAA
jgi:hypothetical protein